MLKNIGLLSIITVVILLNGCGEDANQSASDTTAKAIESTKKALSNATDASKEAVSNTVEVTKEATAKAVEATKEAATETVKKVDEIIENIVPEKETKEGAALYAKCTGCHGVDGQTKALGKSALVAGQTQAVLIEKLNAYKSGTRNEVGMGGLMKGQMASLSDENIVALATYMATLK